MRTVRVEGTSFLINGKPFYFKGFGKHEDSAFHGRGMDVCLDVKDVNLIHWLHANSFRTSHYPYAEEMYRLCDREGIVIIDEVPAVGIGAGAGINPYETFPIREHHEQVIKDMIAATRIIRALSCGHLEMNGYGKFSGICIQVLAFPL